MDAPHMTAGGRTLLRGGHLVTLDPELGDLESADLLIVEDRIEAIGPSLDVQADAIIDASEMLVVPGFIDAHNHLWQAPLRGMASEAWAGEYFPTIHPLSGRYRAEDLGVATYAAAVDLLRFGVTTVMDFCHSVNSPEHADAAVEALRRAGIRALFGYSFRDRPEVERRAFTDLDSRLEDARRLRSEQLADDDALVRMAVALDNVGHVDAEAHGRQIQCARELGLLMAVHTILPGEIATVQRRGQLGPDIVWVHATTAFDAELRMLAAEGGAVAATPEVETGMEGLFPMVGRCRHAGVPVVIGPDTVSIVGADPLVQMRFAFQVQRLQDARLDREQGRALARRDHSPTLSARDVLRIGTLGAAEVLGLADRTGSLTPGKDADIVLLRAPLGIGAADPAAHVVLHASSADVDSVFVRGRQRVRAGKVLDVDHVDLRRRLDEARTHVLAGRAGEPALV